MKYHDWIKELRSEHKAHERYRNTAQKVVDRYEDEEAREENQYNILWSNVEVIHSAVYANAPSPDIRRRYLDRDPAGKQAAEVSERAVSYSIDSYDFNGMSDVTIDDYLIAGLGQVRLRYEPFFDQGPIPRIPLEVREIGLDESFNMTFGAFNGEEEVTDFQRDELGNPFIEGEPEEELVGEEVTAEPINWKRFRWQPSARWEDVDWCSIEHYMTLEELEDNYGEEASKIPLGYTETGEKATNDDDKARALIHEIFDKKTRKNIELAEGYDVILKEEDDPLGLEGFYPFPKPLMATLKNGKFIPIPDYIFYQDQAIELDRVSDRINLLTEELKYRGVYDGSFKDMPDVSNLGDGDFSPIDDFQDRFPNGQGDLEKLIATMPIEEIQRVIAALYVAREQIKQVIFEITGIADIMRGSSKSSETLGAQQLKTQFGSMRLQKRQRNVAAFMRDIIRLKVEIMVENFSIETLQDMTGQEITPEVEEILNNDLLRSYRIDIETDSTITEDAQEEKRQRLELVKAISDFTSVMAPQVQAGLMPQNVFTELLGFAVRGFKIGRTLEDTLDEMGGDGQQDPRMQQMQGQMQQQVQKMKQQAEQAFQQLTQQHQKEISKLQEDKFNLEKKLAINVEKSQAQIAESRIKGDISVQAQQDKAEISGQLEMFKAQLNAILSIPDERNNKFEEVINVMGQAFQQLQRESQETADSFNQQIEETRNGLKDVTELMKRPAKIIRDSTGKVTGAARE